MADKTSFTPDEWARVVASPLLVGMAITAADPSGVWGLLKEGMAGGWALVWPAAGLLSRQSRMHKPVRW